jgi:hypothetical protein
MSAGVRVFVLKVSGQNALFSSQKMGVNASLVCHFPFPSLWFQVSEYPAYLLQSEIIGQVLHR